MRVELPEITAEQVEADVLAIGLFEDAELPRYLAEAAGAADVKANFKRMTMLRPEGRRVLVVGLGPEGEFDAERARVLAAGVARQAGLYEATTLAWQVPGDAAIGAALVEGTILAGFRFDRYKSKPDDDDPKATIESLQLIGLDGDDDAPRLLEVARVSAEGANRARELQSLPANVANPDYLAARAEAIAAANDSITVEILGRDRLEKEGMGGILAVSSGSANAPALIVLRYSGKPGAETLGLVGKAVTFDSGGISIKPSAGMHEMKMDMSGGAAVLEATNAIAELGLPIELISVIPAVENMPSGTAMRPGDVITQLNGKTVEVNNTDAEGRLILADALTWCARQGADRIVDLATLTGAVVVALGSTYAALISNDEEWAAELTAAGTSVGELLWRLPLHAEYKELTKGTIADLTNVAAKRKAGTIYAGSFLEEFVEDKAWAHLDIAGTAWDVGREYVGSGPTGFGVRLLVQLAQQLAREDQPR